MVARYLTPLLAMVALTVLTPWSITLAHAGHGNVIPMLDVDYVKAQYDKGRKLTAINLRSAEAFRRGHLPGARSLPLDELASRFEEVPKANLVVLYCDCAVRALEEAYQFLRQKNYRNLTILGLGFEAWVQRGYPVE